jgi:hypothetical protein
MLEYRISKKRIISLNEVFGPLPAFVGATTRIHGLAGEIVPNSTDFCIRYFFADPFQTIDSSFLPHSFCHTCCFSNEMEDTCNWSRSQGIR